MAAVVETAVGTLLVACGTVLSQCDILRANDKDIKPVKSIVEALAWQLSAAEKHGCVIDDAVVGGLRAALSRAITFVTKCAAPRNAFRKLGKLWNASNLQQECQSVCVILNAAIATANFERLLAGTAVFGSLHNEVRELRTQNSELLNRVRDTERMVRELHGATPAVTNSSQLATQTAAAISAQMAQDEELAKALQASEIYQ